MVPTNRSVAAWLPLHRKLDARPTVAITAGLAAALWHVLLGMLICLWRFEEVPLYETGLLNALDWNWQNLTDVREKNLCLAGLALLLIFVVAYVSWRISRLRQPRAVTLPWFLVCWWQSCLLGTLVIPAGLLLAWWTLGHSVYGLAFVLPYVLIAPAALAPRVIPTLQRWRPVCPECGHTVAYAVEPRCNECGEPYLCPDRFYRRWAIPRLPWDRRQRTLLFAYILTVFWILIRPGRAAWRLSCPDRFGRAARWAIGHALAPIVLVGGFIVVAMYVWSDPTQWAASAGMVLADVPPVVQYRWVLQWLGAWSAAGIVYPVLIGICLARAAPSVQPAARLGMLKWALYAAVVQLGAGLAIVLIAIGSSFVLPFLRGGFFMASWPWWIVNLMNWNTGFALTALNGLYAIWWSIGAASQPTLRRRGFVTFLIAFAAFCAIWGLVPRLFDLRGFEGLL